MRPVETAAQPHPVAVAHAGATLNRMDDREIRDRANELHDYFIDAEKRHDELLKAIKEGFAQLNKTLERSMRDIADALRAGARV
jgi:uncharacterized coiled-coil DUF342 family protein